MGTESSSELGLTSKPSSQEDSAGVVRDVGSKIFIGGLSWDMTEDMLKEYFDKFGEIIEVVVMRDRVTQKPRGFGFVTFRDASAADVILEEEHCIGGKQVDVKKSVPQESQQTAGKIFVGGLAAETTEDDMREYFLQFGCVSEVQIMLDHLSGRSRGFGFVTFEQEESAYAVFTRGLIHTIRGKHVEVKPATPKGSGSSRSSFDASSSSSEWVGGPEYRQQQINAYYNNQYGSPYAMYMARDQSAMMYQHVYQQQQAVHNGMMPYMYMPPGYISGPPVRYPQGMRGGFMAARNSHQQGAEKKVSGKAKDRSVLNEKA